MTPPNDSPDPYSAAIADLEQQVATLRATIDTLKRQRAMRHGEPLPPSTSMQPPMIAAKAAANWDDARMLAQVSIGQLETANCPLTARDLQIALVRTGFMFAGDPNPLQTINVALRAHGDRDVVLCGFGKWGLRKWYSSTEIEELEQKWGGLGGRSADTHAARTREAVRKKIARGETWGKRRTITGEHMAKAYVALRKGMSKNRAVKEADISLPTLYWYWRRFKMEDWQPGLPFPPARRERDLTGPFPKGLMWSHENGHANGKEPQMFSATPSNFPVGGSH
jgi:hypothetical protein